MKTTFKSVYIKDIKLTENSLMKELTNNDVCTKISEKSLNQIPLLKAKYLASRITLSVIKIRTNHFELIVPDERFRFLKNGQHLYKLRITLCIYKFESDDELLLFLESALIDELAIQRPAFIKATKLLKARIHSFPFKNITKANVAALASMCRSSLSK